MSVYLKESCVSARCTRTPVAARSRRKTVALCSGQQTGRVTDVVQGPVVRRHCSVEEVTAASRRRFSAAASVTRGGRAGGA